MNTLPQHVALLRAINVGGRFVRMASVVDALAPLGLQDIRSIIASGNLLFRAPSRGAASLAPRIAQALQAALGFEVATFLRAESAWRALAAAAPPFARGELAQSPAVNVMFLAEEPSPSQCDAVAALATAVDRFAVRGREVYWLCTVRQSESTFSAAVLERRLGCKTTLRSWTTVQRLAAALDAA